MNIYGFAVIVSKPIFEINNKGGSMLKYIIKKIGVLIFTIFLISVFTFFAFSVIPGDAALTKLGNDATPERVAELRSELGLDQNVFVRYVNWASKAVRGDFGHSLQFEGYSVSSLLLNRASYTITIGFLSIVLLLIVAFPIGIFAAKYRDTPIDSGLLLLTHTFMAIPSFFMGILLTYVFGIVLKLFTPGKYVSPAEDFLGAVAYLIFPAMAVALPKVAMTVKYIRNAVSDEMDNDYVRTARSKGCDEKDILIHHVLKNAMITVLTFIGLVIAEVLAGSVIVEQVFGVPGMGKFLVNAISKRDFPVVQAAVIYIALVVVVCNTLVDILYAVIDPRIKLSDI